MNHNIFTLVLYEVDFDQIVIPKFKYFLSSFFLLPLFINAQWAVQYNTGQGNGYGINSTHSTSDGFIRNDTLFTLGVQVLGSSFSPKYEYFQDSYNLNSGSFRVSKLFYQWDGTQTNDRSLQSYVRYANGYIVNKNGHGQTGAIRYVRNLNGGLIRVDSAFRTLVKTRQLVDSTHSFLCLGQGKDLLLLDWYTGDTIQHFISDSIALGYNGGLDPKLWEIAFYHNDGMYIYLKVGEPTKIYSYGYEILKLNIASGQLETFRTFQEESSIFSSSQKFTMIVKDSISENGSKNRSFHSIYDSQWQKLSSFSFTTEKYFGNATGSVPVFFNDSLVIFGSDAKDPRSQSPNSQVRGVHFNVYDLTNNKLLGSARFFAKSPGSSFSLGQILGVENGLFCFNTQHDVANFNYGMLVCLPLNLNYTDPLFHRLSDGPEESPKKLLEIYPNPVENLLVLNYDSTFDEIRVYNMAGTLVRVTPYSKDNRYNTDLLSTGTYCLIIIAGSKKVGKAIFVKK